MRHPVLGAVLLATACSSSPPANGARARALPVPPDAAAALPLVPEVGFADVPMQPTAAGYAARLFYAFQPATTTRPTNR